MTAIIDLSTCDDPQDVVHQAVQRLVEGGIVALPLGAGSVIASHALAGPAAQRLLSLGKASTNGASIPASLNLRSMATASDYIGPLSPTCRRLLGRVKGGPVVFRMPRHPRSSPLTQLPAPVQGAVTEGETVTLRAPASAVVEHMLSLLPAPLLVGAEQSPPAQATDVAAQLDATTDLVLDVPPSHINERSTFIDMTGRRPEVLVEGAVTADLVNQLSGKIIVFVCTGNTCRSPMAEVLMRQTLAELLSCEVKDLARHGISVFSAGLAAAYGSPANEHAVCIASEVGLDLRRHESQPLTHDLLQYADFIFTMTNGHREAILEQFPELPQGRVMTMAPDESDVADPIGGDYADYQVCFQQLRSYVRSRAPEIARQIQQGE